MGRCGSWGALLLACAFVVCTLAHAGDASENKVLSTTHTAGVSGSASHALRKVREGGKVLVHVSSDGQDTSECGSEAQPCASIAAGVARCGATCSTVSVGRGTYEPFVLDRSIVVIGAGNGVEDVVVRCASDQVESVGIFVRAVPSAVELLTVEGCTRAGVRLDTHIQKSAAHKGGADTAAEEHEGVVRIEEAAVREDEEAAEGEEEQVVGGEEKTAGQLGAARGRVERADEEYNELTLIGVLLRNNSRAVLAASDSLRVSDSSFVGNVNPLRGAAIAYISRSQRGQVFVQRCEFVGNGIDGIYPEDAGAGDGFVVFAGPSDYISVDTCVFTDNFVNMRLDRVSFISTRSDRVVLANTRVEDPGRVLGNPSAMSVLDVWTAVEARIIGLSVREVGDDKLVQVLRCADCGSASVSRVTLEGVSLGVSAGVSPAAVIDVQGASRVTIETCEMRGSFLWSPLLVLDRQFFVSDVTVEGSSLWVPLFSGSEAEVRDVSLTANFASGTMLAGGASSGLYFVSVSVQDCVSRGAFAILKHGTVDSLSMRNSTGTLDLQDSHVLYSDFSDIFTDLPVVSLDGGTMLFCVFFDVKCASYAPVEVLTPSTVQGSRFTRTHSIGEHPSAGAIRLIQCEVEEEQFSLLYDNVFYQTWSAYAGSAIIANHDAHISSSTFLDCQAGVFPGFSGAIIVDDSLLRELQTPNCEYRSNHDWVIESHSPASAQPRVLIEGCSFQNKDPAFSADFVIRPLYGVESPVEFWIQAYGYCGLPHVSGGDEYLFTVMPTRASDHEPMAVEISEADYGLYRALMMNATEDEYSVWAFIRDEPLIEGGTLTTVGPGFTRVDVFVDAASKHRGLECGAEHMPCVSLSTGMQSAFPGDYIHVAPGTYKGGENMGLQPPPRSIIAPWHRDDTHEMRRARAADLRAEMLRPRSFEAFTERMDIGLGEGSVVMRVFERELRSKFATRDSSSMPVIDCGGKALQVIYAEWHFSMANFTLVNCGSNALSLAMHSYLYGWTFANNTVAESGTGLITPVPSAPRKQLPLPLHVQFCLFEHNVQSDDSQLLHSSSFFILFESMFVENHGRVVGSNGEHPVHEFIYFFNIMERCGGAPSGLLVPNTDVSTVFLSWFIDNTDPALVLGDRSTISIMLFLDVRGTVLSPTAGAPGAPLVVTGFLSLLAQVDVSDTVVVAAEATRHGVEEEEEEEEEPQVCGGVHLASALALFSGCSFVNNTATGGPSALLIGHPRGTVTTTDGSDAFATSSVMVQKTVFANNRMGIKQALATGTVHAHFASASLYVVGSTFVNNSAPYYLSAAVVAAARAEELLLLRCDIDVDAQSRLQVAPSTRFSMSGCQVESSSEGSRGGGRGPQGTAARSRSFVGVHAPYRSFLHITKPGTVVRMENVSVVDYGGTFLYQASPAAVILSGLSFRGVAADGPGAVLHTAVEQRNATTPGPATETLLLERCTFEACGHPLLINDTSLVVLVEKSTFARSHNSLLYSAFQCSFFQCTFEHNSGVYGGALSLAALPEGPGDDGGRGPPLAVTVLSSRFENNTAMAGGAIHVGVDPARSTLTVSTSDFVGNSANEGAAVCVGPGRAVMDTCFFERNTATSQSGYAGAVLVLAERMHVVPSELTVCEDKNFCGKRLAVYAAGGDGGGGFGSPVSECCISQSEFVNNTELASFAHLNISYPPPEADPLCTRDTCSEAGTFPSVDVTAYNLCREPQELGDSTALFSCAVDVSEALHRESGPFSCSVAHTSGALYSVHYEPPPVVYANYSLHVSLLDQPLSPAAVEYEVIPGPVDPHATVFTMDRAGGPVYCDERTYAFVIGTVDEYGNPQMRDDVAIEVELYRKGDFMAIPWNMSYVANGAYLVSYSVDASNAGEVLVANVTVESEKVASMPLEILPSDVDPKSATFEFHGPEASKAWPSPTEAGELSTFWVSLSSDVGQLRECVAEECMEASLTYTGSECGEAGGGVDRRRVGAGPALGLDRRDVQAVDGVTVVPTTYDCSPLGDAGTRGKYRFAFMAEKMGCYHAKVQYNGVELAGAGRCLDSRDETVPCDNGWFLYVHAGAPSLSNTLIECAVCTAGAMLVGTEYEWEVEVRDAFGNTPGCIDDDTSGVPTARVCSVVDDTGHLFCADEPEGGHCIEDEFGDAVYHGTMSAAQHGDVAIIFNIGSDVRLFPVHSYCPPGTRLEEGEEEDGSMASCVSCPIDTFQPDLDGTVCDACPPHSSTLSTGNKLPDACSCDPGYYLLEDDGCVWCGGLWQEVDESCEGGDTCAPGHADTRCATCIDSTFSFYAYCADCNIAWIGLCYFLVMGIGITLVYLFSAFYHAMEEILILVRFVQFTALLVYLRAPWPKDVIWLFASLSFSTLNDQLLALPCWGITQHLAPYLPFLWPVFLQPVLVVSAVAMIAWRKYALSRQWLSESNQSSAPSLMGIMSAATGSSVWKSQEGDAMDFCSFFWRIYRSLNLLLLMFLYIPLTFVSLLPWNCVEAADGLSFVLLEGTVECYDWSGEWFWDHALPSMLAFALWGLGTPVGLALLLLHHKQVTEQEQVGAEEEDEEEMAFLSSHRSTRTAATRSTTPYNLNCLHFPVLWWWPVLVLLEGLVAVLVLQLVTDHVAQLLSFVLLLVEMCSVRYAYRNKVAALHSHLHWIATLVPLAHLLVLGASTPLVLHDPTEATPELVLPIAILVGLSLTLAAVIALWLGLDARRRRGSWNNSRMFDARPYESAMKLVLEQDAVLRSWEITYSDLDIEHPPIARGAYGIVSRAMYNGTVVAVKTLLYGIGEEERVTEEFHREIQNYSRLHHPNIVLFIGACLDPLCIVIEYVERGSLADILKREREAQRRSQCSSLLPPPGILSIQGSGGPSDGAGSASVSEERQEVLIELEEGEDGNAVAPSSSAGQAEHWVGVSSRLPWTLRISIAIGAARGMAYLHSKGIIHRDLKSPNILITADWDAKITDFGGSRATSIQSRGLMTKTNIGTTRWLAPEVHLGLEYTQAVDVYSFGIVLWELLAGKIPFADVPWDAEVVDGVVKGVRPPLPPYTPPELGKLIVECWDGDPAKRPDFKYVLAKLVEFSRSIAQESSTG